MESLFEDDDEYNHSVNLKEDNLTFDESYKLAATIDVSPEQESHTMCYILPDDIWFHVFSFLPVRDLLNAEQVCEDFKELVDKHLRTRPKLCLDDYGPDPLQFSQITSVLNRYGGSLRRLIISNEDKLCRRGELLKMLVNLCPNIVTLELYGDTFVDDDTLLSLALKLNRLQELTLYVGANYTDEGLGFLLLQLQKLKNLKCECRNMVNGKGFDHLGPLIEDLTLYHISNLPPSIFSNMSTKFRNLRKLNLYELISDDSIFKSFSKKCVNIIDLSITVSHHSADLMLIELSKMKWLERLYLLVPDSLDDNRLKLLFNGHPRLRTLRVSATGLTGDLWTTCTFTDEGVKYILKCCPHLVDLNISANDRLTDQSMKYLADYGLLKSLLLHHCESISDRGCIEVVTRSPQLELFCLLDNEQITEAIITPCLKAVLTRPNKGPLTVVATGTGIEMSMQHGHPRFILDFSYGCSEFQSI